MCRRYVASGFTLVELLVVVAIIGILMAILLPAVQAAREAARRMSCSNNLKQIGLAVDNFEGAHRRYPPSRIIFTEPTSGRKTVNGLLTLILPFIEETNIAEFYDYEKGFDHADNQSAVNMAIPVYQCPSVPGSRVVPIYNRFAKGAESPPGYTAQATDYLHPRVAMDFAGKSFGSGALADETIKSGTSQRRHPKDITDGLSRTVLMLESAGHPINYIRGGANSSPPAYFGWYGEWPDTVGMFVVPYTPDGTTPSFVHPSCGSFPTVKDGSANCIMNCNNNQAPYSLHPGGINVVLCDGSVRFLSEDIEAQTFWGLCCRNDGNVLGDY